MSQFSTTGGRPAAHVSTGRMPADQNPAHTDWKALGLDFNSPFAILSLPRAPIKATPPKPKKARKTQRDRVLASLEDPKPSASQIHIVSRAERNRRALFNTDIPSRAESDRTLAIAGRGLS